MPQSTQHWVLRWDVNQQIRSSSTPDEAQIEHALLALNNETRTLMLLECEGVGGITVMGGKRVLVHYVPMNSDTNPRRLVDSNADPASFVTIGHVDGQEDAIPAVLTSDKQKALAAVLEFFRTQVFSAQSGWVDDWPNAL